MFGNIPQIPGVLPTLAARTAYTVPAAEDRLMQYRDIDVWMQPDLGNARSIGGMTTIAGRKGYVAQTNASTIALGTGMADTVETVNFPGGTVGGKNPLHVPGYEISGDYFAAFVLRWDASISLTTTVYRIFSAGIAGGADVELYMQNNALYQRHGSLSNASGSSVFTAGNSYLIWASYDATLNQAAFGVNSARPRAQAATNLSGVGGSGRPVVIGGQFSASGANAENLFHGQIRAAFFGRTAWVASDKALIRQSFLGEVASLYGNDFTLS